MHCVFVESTTLAGPGMAADVNRPLYSTLLYFFVPVSLLVIVVVFGFWVWRRHNHIFHEALPQMEPAPLAPPSPELGLRPLQLLEIKARGRFGCVWKAQMIQQVTQTQTQNCLPRPFTGVGLVVNVSASHMVGHGFASRSAHTKDHHRNGTNCLPAWLICVRVRV